MYKVEFLTRWRLWRCGGCFTFGLAKFLLACLLAGIFQQKSQQATIFPN